MMYFQKIGNLLNEDKIEYFQYFSHHFLFFDYLILFFLFLFFVLKIFVHHLMIYYDLNVSFRYLKLFHYYHYQIVVLDKSF